VSASSLLLLGLQGKQRWGTQEHAVVYLVTVTAAAVYVLQAVARVTSGLTRARAGTLLR
jgi:hypothetical protein